MSERNREAALKIAERMLPKKNPPGDLTDQEVDDLELAVSAFWSELRDNGVNISSLSETDVIRLLKDRGLSDDAIQMALEEQATWSSGDDEDESVF